MSKHTDIVGARDFSVEEGTIQIHNEEMKERILETDWSWGYWCELMISKTCICVCIGMHV